MLEMPKLPKADKGTRIALIGPMATGKTWCAEQLVSHRGYRRISLAAKLKALAYEMYGITGKDGNDRLVLQGLGTDLRKYDKDVWIKYLLSQIKHVYSILDKDFKPKFVIDDIRYQNEAEIFRKNGFTLIRVQTPDDILSGRLSRLYPNRPPQAALHASETEQEGIQSDYTFINDEQLSPMALSDLMDKIDG